ncbi:MAG: ABC transporter ATP-binding protein [Oscillospiraceae bacterium]
MAEKIELVRICKEYRQGHSVIKNLNLTIKPGSFTVLLGPSGCGKSTILRMIAGLERETEGDIMLGGVCMKDVAPGERNIAMVFQNYALYPTMTVKENMEFGLRNMKVPKQEREARILEVAKIVGLSEYLARKPSTLSGGQRQRVALARAMVKKPNVFLMDEPLSNLDAKLRGQLRAELIALHHRLKATFVYVTHDQVEAMSMGTDIVLLKEGEIVQQAGPMDIYHAPAGVFAAQFIGSPSMNVIHCEGGAALGYEVPVGAAYIGFRPEHAELTDGGMPPAASLTIAGELTAREMLGAEQLCTVSTGFGKLYVKLYEQKPASYGPVCLCVKEKNLHFFDKEQNAMAPTLKVVE